MQKLKFNLLRFLEFFFIMPIFTKNEQQLCIPIASSSVHFLQSPEQFYQELMKRISTSGKRIILSALYLGTGEKEQAIIEELQNTMERNNRIKIAILLDYFRGTRNDHSKNSNNSSIAILRPLITNNFMVYLFHTPEMRGFLKNLLPKRINEIIGLQHMKFFIFDDSIIVSGANLSEQYFENRQDRYLLIENSPILADFFHSVFNIISRHSLKLESNGDLKFDGNQLIHPFTGSNEEIAKSVREEIGKLYEEYKGLASANQMRENPENCETFLVPFLQMGAFKIDEEIQMLNRLFNNESEPLDVTLVTAYFNLYDEYADLILRKCNFPVKIIFGSPNTNGFYGAAGKSGQIPALYEQNILDFMKRVVDSGREKIEFLEWNRQNWTFHAKGIWANSGDGKKMATIVGSSNYGYRSAHRDLEAQVLLITENEVVKNKIMEEKNSLLEYAETQDVNAFLRRNHLIPTWVKYFSRIFRNFF